MRDAVRRVARCHRRDARRRRASARRVAAARRPGRRARRPAGSSPTALLRGAARRGAPNSPPAGSGCPASLRRFPPRRRGAGRDALDAESSSVARVRGTPVAGPFDLAVHAGEVLGVIGPNGAGKSTLGLTLAGLIRPAAGRVAASARSPAVPRATRSRGRPRCSPASARSSRTPSTSCSPRRCERSSRSGRALSACRDGDRRASTNCSSGCGSARSPRRTRTRSRAARSGGSPAAMLATRPQVMVLDEPTFGQDAATWAELVALLDRRCGRRGRRGRRDHARRAVLEALRARPFAVATPAADRAARPDRGAEPGRQAGRRAADRAAAGAHDRPGVGRRRPGPRTRRCSRPPGCTGGSSGSVRCRSGSPHRWPA